MTKVVAATTSRQKTGGHPLAGLRNVGPAVRADFDLLGIRNLAQLAASDADTMPPPKPGSLV